MENKSHATEIMQKTRLELENGDISDSEIDDAIRVRQGDQVLFYNCSYCFVVLTIYALMYFRPSASIQRDWNAPLVDRT
jgi:hypothetical protein